MGDNGDVTAGGDVLVVVCEVIRDGENGEYLCDIL